MATRDVSDSVPATGTLNHHKTITLAQLLGIKRCFALGVLEALWDATTTLAPQGDIGRVSNRAIALQIEYYDDCDRLIECLVDSGYLDKSETYRLTVHDWSEHASSETRTYLARRRCLFLDGSSPLPNQHLRLDSDTRCGRRRKRIRAAGGEASPAMRRRIFDRDGNACKQCGATGDLTVDHKKPVALGGLTIEENLQILCRPCNGRKKDIWLFVQ